MALGIFTATELRHHGYCPLALTLTTASVDGERANARLDLGTGFGTHRTVNLDDGRGELPYKGVGDTQVVRYAVPTWPTVNVIANGVTTDVVYQPGTGGRTLAVYFLNPELVRELNWGRANSTSAGIRLAGVVPLAGFVCARAVELYGGQITHVSLPVAARSVLLSLPVSAVVLPATLPGVGDPVYVSFGGQSGQGNVSGQVNLRTVGEEAGVIDLRAQRWMTRLWAANCGLRRVQLPVPGADTDVDRLEELVLAYNSLGTYDGLPPWNYLPLSLKLLMLGSVGVAAAGNGNINGQVLAAGGSLPPADLDLSAHHVLQYLYANGAGLSGALTYSATAPLTEIVAARNRFTALHWGVNGPMVSPTLRLLILSGYNGAGIVGTGQSQGAGIAVQDFSGAVGLRVARINDSRSTAVIFPAVNGLLEWQGYANAITSITREGHDNTNALPASMQIFRLGGGALNAPGWSPLLRSGSAFNTSYGQTTTVGKRTLYLTGGTGLVEIDARHSNLDQLVPQANKAATRLLIFSPITSYSLSSGYNVTTEANNNAFTAVGALNLTGYDWATNVIANHCRATNASLVLPGGAGQAAGAGTLAQHPNNPVLQLELAGNNFAACPIGPADYPNLLSLDLGGHRTAGYPKLTAIPTAHMSNLLVKCVHTQALTGQLSFAGNARLRYFYGQTNKFGAAAGAAATAMPADLREFVCSDQTPAAGLVNKFDFSACTAATLDNLMADNARVAAVTLPSRPVTGRVTFGSNASTFSASAFVVPTGFSMPNTALRFSLEVNNLASLPAGLLAAIGTSIRSKQLVFGGNALPVATINALIEQVFSTRAAFATTTDKQLILAGGTNGAPTGTFTAPVDYVPGMSEAALTTASAGWTARQKLWALNNRYGWAVTYNS